MYSGFENLEAEFKDACPYRSSRSRHRRPVVTRSEPPPYLQGERQGWGLHDCAALLQRARADAPQRRAQGQDLSVRHELDGELAVSRHLSEHDAEHRPLQSARDRVRAEPIR